MKVKRFFGMLHYARALKRAGCPKADRPYALIVYQMAFFDGWLAKTEGRR